MGIEHDYLRLNSRAQWRDEYGVWANWNGNGEVVRYVVQKGGLNVWEGPAAGQVLKDSSGRVLLSAEGQEYALQGGAWQIVIDPNDLNEQDFGRRLPTPWGYGNDLVHPNNISMVGVPRLQNNYLTPNK